MNVFDAIVVGGGVGGAYAAWRLQVAAEGSSSPLPPVGSRDILLLEGSDRIGGRLESLTPPGAPNLRAEFGGMGYTSNNTLVTNLVQKFSLAHKDFPRGDGNNLLYLRGVRFPKSDALNPSIVPYRLVGAEQGKNPMQLVIDAVTSVFGANSVHYSTDDWRRVLATFVWLGRPMRDIGWWNFLSTVMSHEAFDYATQGMGHFFQLSNWNCAEAIPWFMGDGAAKYQTLSDGYDTLPKTLVDDYLANGGGLVPGAAVTSVTQESSGVMRLESTQGIFHTKRVVLAMPRRALEIIAPESVVLNRPEMAPFIGSVTGQGVMKIFLTYDQPWWHQVNIKDGSSATDLPLGNSWYFGPDSAGNQNSLLMASYNDTLATTYWEGLAGGTPYADRPNPHVTSYNPASTWSRQAASEAMVGEVTRQLVELHGLTQTQIPEPYSSSYKDWSLDPFGGAFYTWNVGVDAADVMAKMLHPDPSVPLHVVGSAYSRDQGWAEGALRTSEALMQQLDLAAL